MTSTVFIGNLTWATTDADLTEFVLPIGEAISAKVQRHRDTQRSKGWGLVEFASSEVAAAVVEKLNGTILNGRAVHLRFDRTKEPKAQGIGLFVGNLPWDTTKEEIMNLFATYDPLDCVIATNMTGKSRGFAILSLTDQDQANCAIETMHQSEFKGRLLECHLDSDTHEKPRQKRQQLKVFVNNLPSSMTETDLLELFSIAGEVTSVVIRQTDTDTGSKRWGIVKYTSPMSTKNAIKVFHGKIIDGEPTALVVRYDRK